MEIYLQMGKVQAVVSRIHPEVKAPHSNLDGDVSVTE
jgi:hypothetical protein